MIYPIVYYPDPVLRKEADKVLEVTSEIKSLSKDMIETMRSANGIGLAAPQIGKSIQLAVIDIFDFEDSISYLKVDGKDAKIKDICPFVFMNPVIETLGKDDIKTEGCLSFPNIQGDIRRKFEIKAILQTFDKTITLETDGLLARAIQHEADHLFGKLFIDYMSFAKKTILKSKFKKMKNEFNRK